MFYLGLDGYDLHDMLLIIIALVGNGVGAKLLYISYNIMCKQLKYIKISKCDIANGPGVRTVLWVFGCNHHCKIVITQTHGAMMQVKNSMQQHMIIYLTVYLNHIFKE